MYLIVDRVKIGLKSSLLFILSIYVFVLFYGCAGSRVYEGKSTGKVKLDPYTVNGKTYYPLKDIRGFRQTGTASWYGKDFHGKLTSYGEVYNMYKDTAAHKTLPNGAWVRVKNLDNDKVIDVRINDRGPFEKGRIIDLSFSAAKKLGVVGPGTARVEITVIKSPKYFNETAKIEEEDIKETAKYFSIQAGVFGEKENADQLNERLSLFFKDSYIVPIEKGGRTLYSVRVGRHTSRDSAQKSKQDIIEKGFKGAFIIYE